MTRHRTDIDVPSSKLTTDRGATVVCRPALRWRMLAAVCGARLDAQIDNGVPIRPDTVLGAHAWRITSSREREQLARALRSTLDHHPALSPRVPVNRAAVRCAAPLIDAVTRRLHAPPPVRVRGMARLRLLLADGRGPLYRTGSGSLNAQLRGVLATL